jgi:hypothetical protein
MNNPYLTLSDAVAYSNEHTPPEYRILCEGLRVINSTGDVDVTIVAETRRGERVMGDCFAHWVVIAEREATPHPFVVWNAVARTEGWHFEAGEYYATYDEAYEAYERRGGR